MRTVEECRADIALAYYNVKQGVESVLAQEAAVSGLPNVQLEELRALPQLAQGLAFAALQVHRDLRAAEFGPLFEQALHARRKLLKAAEALAVAELITVWTPLNQRHEVLWRCGAWLFGREVDDHVPPLQARHVRARKAQESRGERGAARAAASEQPSGEGYYSSSRDMARGMGGPDARKVRFMIRVGADLSKL